MIVLVAFDSARFILYNEKMIFAWDEQNTEHIGEHGVTPAEAEIVVETAEAPWPQQKGEDKLLVWGPTDVGRLLQVIFAMKDPEELEFDALTVDEWADLEEGDQVAYVIHAMDLTPAMKRLYRRQRRRT